MWTKNSQFPFPPFRTTLVLSEIFLMVSFNQWKCNLPVLHQAYHSWCKSFLSITAAISPQSSPEIWREHFNHFTDFCWYSGITELLKWSFCQLGHLHCWHIKSICLKPELSYFAFLQVIIAYTYFEFSPKKKLLFIFWILSFLLSDNTCLKFHTDSLIPLGSFLDRHHAGI